MLNFIWYEKVETKILLQVSNQDMALNRVNQKNDVKEISTPTFHCIH